jgi:hypothetical protein
MAHLDLSHVDHRRTALSTLLAARLNRMQRMLLAAGIASMTILGVAAAMMMRLP